MSKPPSTKPAVKTFRQGRDGDGQLSIEVSDDGRTWTAGVVGLDQAAVDRQLIRLKQAGAKIARAAR